MILLLFSLQDIINYTIPNLLVGRRGSLLDYSQFDREVNVSRSVCQSFCLWGGGVSQHAMGRGWVYFSMRRGVSASGFRGVYTPGQTPPGHIPPGKTHPTGQTSPWADIPLDTYPLVKHPPLGRSTPRQTPPRQTLPRQNRHLLVRHPLGQTPPRQTPSCIK